MSVIEKLKTESLRMRKERDPLAPKLVFALSEIDKVGKNAGNRETTEDEAIKAVQKIVSNIDQTIDLLPVTSSSVYDLQREKKILLDILPQMASDDEVRDLLKEILGDEKPKNKGIAMKVIRDQYGAKVDMKRAGEIVTELYGV